MIIAAVVILQIIVIIIVVSVLRKLFHRQLVDSAIHEFEVAYKLQISNRPLVIQVVFPKALDQKMKDRLVQIAKHKFGENIKFDYAIDPLMRGGLIIKYSDKTIDHSVRSRLKQSGLAS